MEKSRRSKTFRPNTKGTLHPWSPYNGIGVVKSCIFDLILAPRCPSLHPTGIMSVILMITPAVIYPCVRSSYSPGWYTDIVYRATDPYFFSILSRSLAAPSRDDNALMTTFPHFLFAFLAIPIHPSIHSDDSQSGFPLLIRRDLVMWLTKGTSSY